MVYFKKIGLLVVALFMVGHISFAQSFSLTPNDTFKITGAMEDLHTLTINQHNKSINSITMAWKKVSENIPLNWEALVCDNKICYASLADSGEMIPVQPADSAFLLIKITPHVNYGTALIRYAIWDIGNPTLKDTLTYIIVVNNVAPIEKPGYENKVTIFPNPSKDNLLILSNSQEGFNYKIMDMCGKEIQAGFSDTNSISLLNFSNGFYTILMINKDHSRHTKKFIVQN